MKLSKILIIIFFVISQIACNKEQAAPQDLIIGKWKLVYYGTVKKGETLPELPKTAIRALEFKKDFTVDSIDDTGVYRTDSYSIEKDILIIPDRTNSKISFATNDVLYIRSPDDNEFDYINKYSREK